MTVGSPMKLIASYTGPLIFGFLFQQLYNFADAMIVSRFLGTEALAAVGSTGSLNFLLLGFLMGVCSGFAIPVAQSFGARDIPLLRRYVINGALLSGCVAIAFTLTTSVSLGGVLRLMRTPADIFPDAYAYMLIILLGIPVSVVYNFLSGVIRALGDSKTPVYYLTLASLLNVALDLLFILVFKTGVWGAALATVISQAISALLCLLRVKKSFTVLQFVKSDWKWDGALAKKLIAVGLPMGLQFSITAVGSVILQSAVNGIGSAAVAAVTAGSKLTMLFASVFDALSATAATFAGQNLGAKKPERIAQGIFAESVLGIAYAGLALAVILLFGKNLLSLFVDAAKSEVAENAFRFLRANAFFYVPLLYVNILRLTIQGMGRTSFAVFAGVFEMLARTVVGLVLVPRVGYFGVCCASPAAWTLAALFLIPACAYCIRRAKKELVQPAASAS